MTRKTKMVDWSNRGGVNPLRALWRAVIMQLILDIGSNKKSAEAQYNRFEAINFIKGKSRDFYDICDMADMCPRTVRRVGLEAIEKGVHWRAAPGEDKRYAERSIYRIKKKMGLSVPRKRKGHTAQIFSISFFQIFPDLEQPKYKLLCSI